MLTLCTNILNFFEHNLNRKKGVIAVTFFLHYFWVIVNDLSAKILGSSDLPKNRHRVGRVKGSRFETSNLKLNKLKINV